MAPNSEEAPDSDPYSHPDFPAAFESIPNQFSHIALALYLTFKCMHLQLKGGSGSSIRAAFKDLWKHSAGDLYRGVWTFNAVRNQWEGNPVDSAEVVDVMTAISHKSGADGGDRTHSLAMSKGHIGKIFAWSDTQCDLSMTPLTMEARILKTKHLEFRAFSSTAWTIWSRCFELVKIKKKDLLLFQENPRAFNLPYHALRLLDHKGWQKKLSKTERETDLKSNTFHIYAVPDLPACDAFVHLSAWLFFLEHDLYKRPLESEDYIFPAMGANGVVHPREPISHDTVQKYINEFTDKAGIAQSAKGSFSTHCFRHGGSQYYFMFAPVGKRWTLCKVRWWGGWAEGEHRNTLIRYLLNELHSYEESFSDALCPIQDDKEISLLGAHHSLEPATHEDLQIMHSTIAGQMQCMHDELTHGIQALGSRLTASTAVPDPLQITFIDASISFSIPSSSIPPPPPSISFSTSTPANAKETALPAYNLVIPDIPVKNSDGRRPHPRESWRWIVRHWTQGDSDRGLVHALKDWDPTWLQGTNKGMFASKYGQRKMIALEFLDQYKGDEARFLEAYPEAEHGHSSLLDAIKNARQVRGDLVTRKRK
ncbi:hypothetical protein BJ912DRAFT_858015 [Pholiota molesta]|nr:hypothetical protein BJ912DRAFT_858015 [Pholiota molesta]